MEEKPVYTCGVCGYTTDNKYEEVAECGVFTTYGSTEYMMSSCSSFRCTNKSNMMCYPCRIKQMEANFDIISYVMVACGECSQRMRKQHEDYYSEPGRENEPRKPFR